MTGGRRSLFTLLLLVAVAALVWVFVLREDEEPEGGMGPYEINPGGLGTVQPAGNTPPSANSTTPSSDKK